MLRVADLPHQNSLRLRSWPEERVDDGGCDSEHTGQDHESPPHALVMNAPSREPGGPPGVEIGIWCDACRAIRGADWKWSERSIDHVSPAALLGRRPDSGASGTIKYLPTNRFRLCNLGQPDVPVRATLIA